MITFLSIILTIQVLDGPRRTQPWSVWAWHTLGVVSTLASIVILEQGGMS